jgi:multidrug efflux pump subunit AcrB/ABC-type multidrug transport system ATPase subunit
MLEFIIKRRTFVSMLFIASTLLGYISYQNLDLELLPSVELPFLIVQVNSTREMDPTYFERQAIIPLEGGIGTLEGIEKIESFAERRQGRIIIYYNNNVNIKYAYLRLQEKVDRIKSTLGDEFFVLVFKIDTEQLSNMFMNLQIRGDGGVDRLRHVFESEIRREFESIDGIANVEVFGGQERSVEIVIDEELCEAYGINPSRLRFLIGRNNQEKLFLGRLYQQQKYVFVNMIADYRDIRDLENIVIDPTVPVLLKDIAIINFDVKDETSISRINGKNSVTVQLIRDTRVNLIELSHLTRNVIEKINHKFESQEIEVVIQQDSAEFLEQNLDLIRDLALTGGLIAVIILWFFLSNIRLVLVIAIALPISIFSAFNLFYAFGITLNSLTLVGMALAVGMLLDNSIVVLENIYRIYQNKKDAFFAVVKGTREIWRSIFAATLTTITVFLPFIFAENFMIRIIGYQVGVSIISTLLISLVVALMLIPMIVFYLLEKDRTAENRFQIVTLRNRLVQIYMLFLKSAMRFPLRTIISAVIIFFTSIVIALALSLNVQTQEQSEDFNMYVTMPGGSTLESTDLAVSDLEARLKGIDEVKDLISQIFEEEAILTLVLQDDYEDINDNSLAQIKEILNERIDEFRTAEVSFEEPASSMRFRRGGRNQSASFERMLGVGGQDERLQVKGLDYEIMRRVADDIQYQLEQISAVDRVRVNVASNRPEIQLLFDQQLLNEYEISPDAVIVELANFEREISTGAKYKVGTEEYDILIKDADEKEKDFEDLRTLSISSGTTESYPLEEVSQIIFAEGRGGINRVNQEKQIEISYRFSSDVTKSTDILEESRRTVEQLLMNMEIPSGIAIEMVREESELSDFYFLIGVAFLLIYMILAAVFESLLNPFIIMFTIPLAAIGSLWAIIFTGNSLLNANTLIGFLILLGIVVNNGIILIDYTRLLRRAGFRHSRALMVAGKARLRPIIITALTTIAAMMPLAMGKIEYVTSIAAPFAVTVIGGLSLSTVFTLVLIPTVYSGLENLVQWIRSLDWRIQFLEGLLFIMGVAFIYINVESLLWRIANLFVLLLLIPGITYFILNSLRQAKEGIVAEEAITIYIRNIYKIYDRPSRFLSEWRKGKSVSQAQVLKKDQVPGSNLLYNSWQYLLLVFLVYFIYLFLDDLLWIVVLIHPLYFFILYLWSQFQRYTERSDYWKKRRGLKKIPNRIYRLLFWGLPALNAIILYLKGLNLATTLILAIMWFFAVTVYTSSNRLLREQLDINRLRGRFAGLRKRFYRLIQYIPLIGKKSKPFKALSGISLQIERGMFGLLGPNGAGKTTLMRIICGILEQNFGTIHINTINAQEKREELQGLIGYLPQDFGTYENLTAREFLNYQAILKKINDPDEREKRVNYVISAVHMEKNVDEKIGSFSGGMKQRIGIAQTLLHLPRILVVDEPTAGLDPRERIRFRNLLVDLSRERIVIFSTHIIEDIASSCDQVAVLNKGYILYLGKPEEMVKLARNAAWQFYSTEKEFEEYRKSLNIVHHIKVEDNIRVRCIAKEKPTADAISVPPTLEDAYLWLLSKKS